MTPILTQQEFEENLKAHIAHRLTLKDTVASMLPFEYVRSDVEKGYAELRHTVALWERNGNNVVHGGILASLFDGAMGSAARAYIGGGITPTVTLNVSFLRSVPTDKVLHIGVTLNRCGGTMIYLSAALWAEDAPDDTLATAQGVFYRM